MIIVSGSHGFSIVFRSLEDLRGTIRNLQGQVEWIEAEEIQKPYVYSIFETEGCSEKEMNRIGKELKAGRLPGHRPDVRKRSATPKEKPDAPNS